MYGVNGVPTWNFFSFPFSNHVQSAQGVALTVLSQKFSTATSHIQTLGLKDLAEFTESGVQEKNVKFPWRLKFVAPNALKNQFSDEFS